MRQKRASRTFLADLWVTPSRTFRPYTKSQEGPDEPAEGPLLLQYLVHGIPFVLLFSLKLAPFVSLP